MQKRGRELRAVIGSEAGVVVFTVFLLRRYYVVRLVSEEAGRASPIVVSYGGASAGLRLL